MLRHVSCSRRENRVGPCEGDHPSTTLNICTCLGGVSLNSAVPGEQTVNSEITFVRHFFLPSSKEKSVSFRAPGDELLFQVVEPYNQSVNKYFQRDIPCISRLPARKLLPSHWQNNLQVLNDFHWSWPTTGNRLVPTRTYQPSFISAVDRFVERSRCTE